MRNNLKNLITIFNAIAKECGCFAVGLRKSWLTICWFGSLLNIARYVSWLKWNCQKMGLCQTWFLNTYYRDCCLNLKKSARKMDSKYNLLGFVPLREELTKSQLKWFFSAKYFIWAKTQTTKKLSFLQPRHTPQNVRRLSSDSTNSIYSNRSIVKIIQQKRSCGLTYIFDRTPQSKPLPCKLVTFT